MNGEYVFFLLQHFEVSGSVVSETIEGCRLSIRMLVLYLHGVVVIIVLCLICALQDNIWSVALGSQSSQAAIRAFSMTFVIGQKSYSGHEYHDFFQRVHRRLKEPPFLSNLSSERDVGPQHSCTPLYLLLCGYSMSTVTQVSPYAAYLHDAVLLYALGLKEVLRDGENPHDGRQLLKRLKNKNGIRFYGDLKRSTASSTQLAVFLLK
jgi:hypothetical protein